MKILKINAIVLSVLLIVAGFAWLLRTNPIGPISGRALTGVETPYPDDWGFTDEYFTIALEVRPAAPHSVTTVCFVHEGDLYVPAQSGSTKEWTQLVLDDPRARIKVGERVFPVRAVRVVDADPADYLSSAGKKYDQLDSGEEIPEDIWLFRIEPREG
ncbi:MAG: hypothetical protein JRG89_18950 [Deltaproteobacteria bacterium]|nr:hypothetical protein [Deltaproteobacteria bacterium]MBW2390487.1 hypothetical protein [Deltaproteobacteria bacterium]